MTPEEIQAMAKGLAEGQALWYLLSAIIGGAITGSGAYLAEKGKNRATKEDIGEITDKVEQVRKKFSDDLEDLKAHHQLRMVAAERRLQAHQDAYVWYTKVVEKIQFDEESWSSVYYPAINWYTHNKIFLGPKTRFAFFTSISGCARYRELRKSATCEELNRIKTHEIQAIFPVLFEEVALPSIGEQIDTPQ